MTTIPSATTWGSPTATKHALLIHGLTSSSHTWHRVAASLAAQGYLVTAPNLIGHASRRSPDGDYRIPTIAQDLQSYLASSSRSYTLIIGHSLGGATALHLLPYLDRSHPISIVLVDPGLHISNEWLDQRIVYYGTEFRASKTGEKYIAENPLWSREDGISRALAMRLCMPSIVHDIFTQNRPWNYLEKLAEVSEKWKVTVLLADPEIRKLCPVEDLEPYPHVRHVFVPGAGHWIHCEFPDVVVKEALKTVAEMNAA